MRYVGLIKKIQGATALHRLKVDSLVKRRDFRTKEADKEIEAHKEMWNEAYCETRRAEILNDNEFKNEIEALQEETRKEVSSLLDRLENNIQNVFVGGCSDDIRNIVANYSMTGYKISNIEARALLNKASTFPERAAIIQLLRNGKAKEKEVAADYTDEQGNVIHPAEAFDIDMDAISEEFKLPDAKQTMDEFNTFKNEVNFFVDNYCGENAELCFALPNGQDDYIAVAAHTFHDRHIARGFKEKMDEFAKVDSNALTPEEVKLIDSKINPNFPNLAKDEARRFAKEDPEMEELLLFDNRYSALVSE